MYRRRLPADAWLCLALSVLVALGTGSVAGYVSEKVYTRNLEEHQAVDNEIGGKAGETIFQAQDIDGLLSHDSFTVVSSGIQYRNEGAGYHNGCYMYNVKLPSGERIAAWINGNSVQQMGEDIYTGDSILPVGCVVWEDLSTDKYFLDQIEHGYALSRTDFYVDMVGDTAVLSEEQSVETPKLVTQVLTVFVCFPVFHMIGSKLGIFSAYFPLKKKK